MRSATFRNIALGILALAAVYHLGAHNARAQQGSTVSGFTGAGSASSGQADAAVVVMTPNGDVYERFMHNNPSTSDSLYYVGNFWKAPLVPLRQSHAQPSQGR